MQSYYWVKTFHIVFVVAWMATVFYLPRILVNLAETAGQPAVTERLQLMGLRLYRFGHSMFGLAFVLGLVLWLGYKVIPDFPTMVAPGGAGWLHAKLGLVAVLLVYFSWIGRLLKGVARAGRCRRRARCAGSTRSRCWRSFRSCGWCWQAVLNGARSASHRCIHAWRGSTGCSCGF